VRHVLECRDVLRERPAQGLLQGNTSGRNRSGAVKRSLAGFLPGVGHVPAGAVLRILVGCIAGDGGHSAGVPADDES
jgi:hypothetical protein